MFLKPGADETTPRLEVVNDKNLNNRIGHPHFEETAGGARSPTWKDTPKRIRLDSAHNCEANRINTLSYSLGFGERNA
jgi:hypothetical protein